MRASAASPRCLRRGLILIVLIVDHLSFVIELHLRPPLLALSFTFTFLYRFFVLIFFFPTELCVFFLIAVCCPSSPSSLSRFVHLSGCSFLANSLQVLLIPLNLTFRTCERLLDFLETF